MPLMAPPIRRSSRQAWCSLAMAGALGGALLAGCHGTGPTETPAIKRAGDEMRDIRAQCEARRRSGELTSVTAVERCAEPDVIAAYREAGYPYMDLIRFAEAARLAGAQKVDKGEIDEREYDRQRLELRDRLAAEIDRRNAETPPRRSDAKMPDPAVTAKLVAGLSAFSALGR
jgi:hypothetical protein